MSTALVVDHSAATRTMLAASLRQLGYDVTVLGAGDQVLETVRTIRPALICLDTALPDVGGLAICEQLRRLPEAASIPILMTSQRRTPLDQAQAELAGADDYLVKPFSLTMFADRVRRVARRRPTAPIRVLRSLSTVPA